MTVVQPWLVLTKQHILDGKIVVVRSELRRDDRANPSIYDADFVLLEAIPPDRLLPLVLWWAFAVQVVG